MNTDVLKCRILELAQIVGSQVVSIELQRKGLRPSTSERLSQGTHVGGLKPRTIRAVEAVLKELKAA